MIRHLILAVSGLLLSLSPLSAQAASLSGKATVGGTATAGITVKAFPVGTKTLAGKAPFEIGPTSADGLFNFELPTGDYYLLAESAELFTYYGRNPVAVPAEGLANVNLRMVPGSGAVPQEPVRVESGVLGFVSVDGKPVAGAIATVYTDLNSQFKGFGLGMAAPTDDKGRFEVPLPPGTYYLVVRMRKGGALAGPMRAGDLFGYLPQNPLVIKEKQVARVQVPLIEVPEKVEKFAATLFGNTSISGKIVDRAGKPVAGVHAILYADMMMLSRPAYVSQPSDAQGNFVVSFPDGGTYYLSARSTLGGTPTPGELYGRFAGTPDASIRIRTGQKLEGMTLAVEKVW
ncbi:MAG: DUF4198 domain-containing protein [Desulfuromonadales bacterium]|nr:DUF4198 domain-containing protein [Desulfuromonadales bacterium]